MPKASVIFRFNNQSPQRVKNLDTVIRHASHNPNLEIIVVVMDTDVDLPIFKSLENPPKHRGKIIKRFYKEPFASSRANNIGASLANTDILIFQDADILFSTGAYERIIKTIEGGADAVRVGEWCQNLNAPNTARIYKEHQHASSNGFMAVNRFIAEAAKTTKSRRDAPGACHAISRKAFIEVGGYSERFKVYGWEDCYFRFKMQKLGRVSLEMPMLHLYHEVNYQMRHQPDNAPLYHQLVYANPNQYKAILERDRGELLENHPRIK